jgi:WD40 repeat protein/DNA-directed RNA polymerase subunit M/transcription elongation factor TFIIS
MAHSIECPKCSAVLKTSNPIAPGKKLKCPKCSKSFIIEAQDNEIESESEAVQKNDEQEGFEDTEDEDTEDSHARKGKDHDRDGRRNAKSDRETRKARSSALTWIVTIAGAFLVTCFACSGVGWLYRDLISQTIGLDEGIAKKAEPDNKKDGKEKDKPAAPVVRLQGTIPIDYVSSLCLTPDNRLLAVGLDDNRVRVWDYVAKKEKAVLAGHHEPVIAVALSPDGKYLASGGTDKFVRLWDVALERPIQTYELRSDHPAVAFTPDSNTLIVAGADEKDVKLWDLKTHALKQTIEHPRASALALTPDGKFLAAGGNGATVWNLETGKKIAGVDGHRGIVLAVAMTSDAKILFTASADDTVKIWDTATSTERKTLAGHERSMHCLALTPDGKILAAGSSDGKVSLWEVETGKLITYLKMDEPLVSGLAITKDGKTLLASAHGGREAAGGLGGSSMKLWDLSSIANR